MARQNTQSTDQQEQQQESRGQQQQGSREQQGSRGTQVARNPNGGQMSQRRGSNQFGLALSPFEVFLTNPFSLMRRMTEEMDRAFSEFNGSNNGDTSLWTPAIEVRQRDGQYIVHAELPGLKPEDVRVEVADDALVIEGERKWEHEEDLGGVHRTERRYGRFYRVLPLPEGANAEQARARFENGVLEVAIPISQQQSNRRQIQVEPSSQSAGGNGASGGSSNTTSGATSSSGTSSSSGATSSGSSGTTGKAA